MEELFTLQIITPDRIFYDQPVEMVELTTTEGQMGIYARHIPLTAVVSPGILTIHQEDGPREAALMSGFIQVLPEKVTILAEVAEWPEDIDENRAKEAKARAERRLKSGSPEVDMARAEMALKRAIVRLEVSK